MQYLTGDRAIDALEKCIKESDPNRRYFIDFDFTLLLASSTDEYLQSARPSFLFRPFLKLLGLVRPWVFRGRNGVFLYRDATRLNVMQKLRPALSSDFEGIARERFALKKNDKLLQMLEAVDPSKITIVSFGLKDAIRSMLKGSQLESCDIVASSQKDLVTDRRNGKIQMLEAAQCLPDRTGDVIITDSDHDDRDLLEYVEHGFHIEWL